MKKLVALISVLALTVPVFAAGGTKVSLHRVGKKAAKLEAITVERHLASALAEGASKIVSFSQEQKAVLEALMNFKKEAFTHQYYEYDVMFQLMDNVRTSYMELREKTPAQAREIAKVVHCAKIQVANGERQITIAQYINMEAVNLYPTEQTKFEAFRQALEEDLK